MRTNQSEPRIYYPIKNCRELLQNPPSAPRKKQQAYYQIAYANNKPIRSLSDALQCSHWPTLSANQKFNFHRTDENQFYALPVHNPDQRISFDLN
jgi:hypothetical protein